MSKIYSATDLIRYIYRETTPAENSGIMHQLQVDSVFKEEFENQVSAVLALTEAEFNPSPTSVSIIMEHSQKQHELHN
jgi:hypothetical protein